MGARIRTMKKNTRNNSRQSVERSRGLRGEMSVSERVLWGYLRDERTGFKFRRQYPAGVYFLDFFCREASLAVEVDGEQHADRKDRDATRDEWLDSREIETIRLPSLDLFEPTGLAIGRWIATISSRCEERAERAAFPEPPSPAPSPVTSHTGEGA